MEAWLSGLKRQFAKLVKSFYRLSQVRILLLPLRVAQSTLLSVDLGVDGQRQTVRSSLYFRWGCHGSIHEPSLSEMTLNYISPIQSLAIMARLLYYDFG